MFANQRNRPITSTTTETPRVTANKDSQASVDATPGQPSPKRNTIYLFRRRGQSNFITCDKERYIELAAMPEHFDTMKLDGEIVAQNS